MVDAVHGTRRARRVHHDEWRERVRQVAETEMTLCTQHCGLLDVTDERTAFGPGTIAKYDHELHAFDGTESPTWNGTPH